MEDEAEKMAALKKVYAEIILNTAKEAAARVMVSERKAVRAQRELSTAKDEALNILLRLKKIMDSKIAEAAEAERKSLSQQRKIEELELQLNEAEDVVRDLRYELKEVQDEMERLKSNPGNILGRQIVIRHATHEEEAQEDKQRVCNGISCHSHELKGVQDELECLESIPGNLLDRQTVRGNPAHEEEAQENELHISDGISCHPSDSECKPMSTCIMKNAPLSQPDDKCCSLSENGRAQAETSSMENYCAANPDLACIIMRSKEPELYRNGCTQRIRAFEGNLLDEGKLPLPGHDDDQSLHTKSGEKVEGTCTVASPKTDNMILAEKNMTESEEVMQHDSNSDEGQDGKVVHKIHRRRRTLYRNRKATSCISLSYHREPSLRSCTKTHPLPVNGDADSGEDMLKVSEDEAQRDLESNVDGQARDSKAGSPQVMQKDPASMKKSVLTNQEPRAVKNSEVLVSTLNLDPVDLPAISSDAEDRKTCETTTAAPTEVASDRLLKYTFQRKRKKETMSNANDNALLGKKSTIKMSKEESQNSTPQLQKSSLTIESPRESRRVVQVARQLISLSEKRWW